MGRPQQKPRRVRSLMAGVRLRVEEDTGLKALGKSLTLSPSRLIRCVIREAITGGPDCVENGEVARRTRRHHLTPRG